MNNSWWLCCPDKVEVTREVLLDQAYSTGYSWSITFITENSRDPQDIPQLQVLWHSDSVGDLCPAKWGYPCVRLTEESQSNPKRTFSIRTERAEGDWEQQVELESSDKVTFISDYVYTQTLSS